MFDKKNAEAVALDEERAEGGRGGIGLAYCAGSQAFAVVGRTLRIVASGGPHCPAQYEALPLPGGRVVAVGAGPSVVMSNGALLFWQSDRWHTIGNLNDGPKS